MTNVSAQPKDRMTAIVVERSGGFEVLAPHAREVPTPGPRQVVLRVAAAGVNFIDTLLRAGSLPAIAPPCPFVPGVESSGTVVAIGAGVTEVGVGDRAVYMGGPAAGCYAEYVVAESRRVSRLPAGVDLIRAAALPVSYATAYHMLHHVARVERGQTVLVHAAAGGVGTALVQLAKLAGARVIAVVGSDEKARHARDEGADHVAIRGRDDVAARVMELTDRRGVAASFNPVSGSTIAVDAELLAPFGQLVIFGMLGGVTDATLAEVLLARFQKSIAIRVSDIYTLFDGRPDAFAAMMGSLVDAFVAGKLTPRVFDALPLADAARAHRLLESRTVTGKLLLTP